MIGRIYLIKNLVNGKGYVGQTTKPVLSRFNEHKYKANGGSDLPLHKAFRKYGLDCFVIGELTSCDGSQLNDLERHYIKTFETYAPTGHGYNLTEGGDGCGFGRELSDEGRKTLSEVHKGNSYAKGYKHTDEARLRMSQAQSGREHLPPSEEIKARISSTLMGHEVSEETRRKISEAQLGQIRGPLSDEAKKKIGDKNRGRVFSPKSEEEKLQRSVALKGRKKSPESIAKRTATRLANGFKLSEEAKSKISTTLSGRTHTVEEKTNISDGLRKWWSERKLEEAA